jgi:hypothetical protein
MISLEQYWMGRDVAYPLAMTPQIEANAMRTLGVVNALIERARAAGVPFVLNAAGSLVRSGWRPPAVNAATANASKTSMHMTGEAIDLEDTRGKIDAWMLANPGVLRELGLWQEHPDATPTWAHVQLRPPKSLNRVFRPF